MNYSKLQRYTSSFLIFSILVSFTIRVPFSSFLENVFASDNNRYNIVALIVDEDLYDTSIFSSDVKTEIDRYAGDIQNSLSMTKVMVFPTKSSENPHNIASLLEKLYQEWYKWINWLSWESSLIWAVFVWNIPLPILYNENNSQKSVVPYVDFDDKSYIYNSKTKKYEKNASSKSDLKAEIWHSFISPNTWNRWDDVKDLKKFFNKDHDYYTKSWNFSTDLLKNNKPYVFYFDSIREQEAVSLQEYNWYLNFLNNLEDISYNRFYKYLANKLTDSYLWNSNEEIKSMISSLWLDFDLSQFSSSWPNLTNTPDITTKDIITETIKRFVEIFNSSSIWEMKEYVHNAWRYNWTWTTVSADISPSLITNLDEISRIMVKDANNELEKNIDNLVKNWLSRNIAIPTEIKDSNSCGTDTYTNIIYWQQASNINTAEDCSIYRGSNTNSWNLVEANRWLNINLIQADISKLTSEKANCANQTAGRFGWNSPINLDTSSMNSWDLKLSTHDLTKSITPIFDIWWSKKISDNSKVLSPLNCLSNNFIVTEVQDYSASSEACETTYSVPINWKSRIWWSCSSPNKNYSYTKTFEDLYKEGKCNWLWCAEWKLSIPFKQISSYIQHKSPTSAELTSQIKAITSPNLPVDRDRYIDFISAVWTYDKINYPYLYRLTDVSSNLTIDGIKKSLKEYLDKKSVEINAKIKANNPNNLAWKDSSLYGLLKTWNYPTWDIDLYKIFESKAEKTLNIDWDTKTLSYLDTLVFSLYWTKLNSVSAKYKFIFENYLSDQFWNNNIKFPLPSNKKMYEISYLWASWDSQNMYINIDPAKSADNPYADIIAKNVALSNSLLSTNIWSQVEENNNSSCWPPEWVPLWQWIPAVMCRLTSLLPPKIAIGWWSCWGSETIWLSESSQNELDSCNKDSNKNWIIDCQEKINSINLLSNSEKYSYNTTWNLEADILDANWKLMDYDTFSDIWLELLRVDIAKDNTKDLSVSNRETIYNKEAVYWNELNNSWALEKVKEYILFNDIKVKAKNWKVKMIFSTKNKDADFYFRASFVLKDTSGKITSNIKSNILTLKSRWDALNVTSYNLDNNWLIDWSTWVKASDKQNVFIIDWNNNDINNVKSIIKDASSSNDKLIFDLKNFLKDWKKANLYYPIKAELYKDSTKLETISIPSVSSYKSLFSIKESGDYKIYFTDNNSSQVIKDFQVISDIPSDIRVNMSTNSTDVWWIITNHIVSLYDKYWNINSGELYNIESSISWNAVNFDDWNNQKTLNIFDWYENFKLKSTDSSWESEIKFLVKDNTRNLNLEKKVYIKTVSDIKANILIENENSIKVWWNTYKYKLEIKDSNWNLLTDFNSKAYLNIDSVYWSSLDNVININSWIWEWSFKTTTIAWKAVNLNFSVEWLKNSISKTISIHPDKAMKIDMILANSKLEATSTSSTNLALELKDRYWNLVFDDSSTKLKLEIPDSYKHILNFSAEEKQVSWWKTNFIINATDIPGISYLKVSSNPSLWENNFSVSWQTPFLKTELNNTIFKNSSWLTIEWEKFFYEIDSINYRFKANSLELLKNSSDYIALSSANKSYLDSKFEEFNSIKIYWVWENAIKLETYYFWNKSKIIDKKYNSLYTALLWSSYWDFTKKDYLAWAMLFDENNRSLAVSSLLNTPLNYSNLISISPSWNITQNNTDDLTQDISITYSNSSKNLNFNIFNKALNTYIWKIYFKWENNLLPVCTKDNIDDCYSSATGIFWKLINSSYKIENIYDKVVLKNENWNILFSISKDLKIENNWVSISINSENTKDYLLLDLDYNWETISSIWIKLNNSKLDLSRDEWLFTNKINTISDWTFVFLQSYNYWTTEDYTATSTNENKGISIYYNDPFSTTSTKTSSSVESNSFANFENKAWIWWERDNKTLLLLSSGENVWDATKNYQSLSSINLWDPVISLAKKDPKLPGTNIPRKFDSSIWQLLWKWVKSYAIFDYNNDWLDDIVYLTDNWFIKLYEQTNTEEKFKDLWNLFYLADIDDNFPIITWDFTGDNFDDVFFVDTLWKPVLLNNDKKHFSRIDLYDKFGLNSRISQIVWFDMNNDKKYDLVSLDEEWDINIFYGWWNSWDPQFTKNKIDSGYALKLNSKTRTDLRAIYFDWMYQLPIDSQAAFLANSEKLNQKIKAYNEAVKVDPSLESSSRLSQTEFNEEVIDKLLFLQLNYDPQNIETITSSEAQQNILSSMPSSLDWDTYSISSDMKDAKTRISNLFTNSENLNPNWLSYSSWITNSNKITTFLRSEYSSVEWVSIKKIYNDKNWNYLKSWDKVSIKVEITNNKSTTIRNVSYLDEIPEPLSITDDTIFKFKKWTDYKSISPKSSPDWSSFDFMIDHFDLAPSETITLEYDLETQSFLIGYIKAWLFEKWELWDDSYGDIIVKNSWKNCWEENTIYRSTTQTTYEKWRQSPTCDENKSTLPEEAEKNSTDTDNNWVPDYIDALKVNNWQNEDFLSYSKEKLNAINFDSDWDWVPDTNDINEDYNEDNWDLLGSLNNFTDSSMKTLNWVEKMINWLGCWFGNASCIASPLNWAPLASGSDPTLFWCPVWDWLNVWEWLPILSLFTWLNIPTPRGCYQAPVFWPMSPFMFLWSCNTSLWAWWRLWTTSPTNTFRLFVTPTITGWVWIEACFGWPAIVAWNIPTKWASPIVPGWNCIVTAVKWNMCKDDWSDWDVGSIWYSEISDFEIINANCSTSSSSSVNSSLPTMENGQVSDYINYKRTGQKSESFVSGMKSYLWTLQNSSNYNSLSRLNSPLLNFGSSNSSSSDFNLTLDTKAAKNWWGFSDILKIDLKRIFPFPDFLMEWWTRQIEEIVTKLTDWPTIFVILPDFSWIFNSWWNNFFDKTKSKFNKWRETQAQKNKIIDQQINALNAKDCWTDETCKYNQALKKRKLQASKYKTWWETMSWIRQVYEFLWNLPMISIWNQAIDVNIPWADSATISKAIIEFQTTKNQWQAEISEKQKMWSGWEAKCDSEKTEQAKAKCKSDYAYSNNLALNSSALLSSLNQNIATLKEYKKIPEKVNKMLKIKEVRLSQILCNVETITKIMWWRLWQNWKRFKSWVQLYITVKAILKSWQLILDIFYEYDASCHDCKNERSDLLYCIFKLVSMIIPKIPVIQFPKWPDIIVDLHNVRANLDISLPDYKFNLRPITIPSLGNLWLPNLPNASFSLPKIPTLPNFVLPELPDLPTLPTVTLPDLPPPPKLPKLFAWIEAVLDILKLITKIMCILKKNPFVPEWRAWDQISFLTERSGYLPFDFLDLALPQFSYPFVDAIKVTSFVNLEFESDFITEFSRNMVLPINSFANNIVNIFDYKVSDIDMSQAAPSDVNVKVGTDWSTNTRIDWQKLNYSPKKWINLYDFSMIIAKNINSWISHIIKNSEKEVNSGEFISLVNNDLEKTSIIKDNKTEKLRNLWTEVNNYNYSKEDKIINDLIKNNTEKFDTLKSIIKEEIKYNKELEKKFRENKLSLDNKNILISSNISRIDSYKASLDKFNNNTISSIINLTNYDNEEKKELKAEWNKVLTEVKTWAKTVIDWLEKSDLKYTTWLESIKNNLLSATSSWSTTISSTWTSCNTGAAKTWNTNQYSYKWLYVIENNISYRLFDYLWEITWDEKVESISRLNNSDKDLVYKVWDELYLKSNYKAETKNVYYSWNPIIVDSNDVKFYNNSANSYIPSINGFSESIVDSNNINVAFSQPKEDISNFRIEFFNIVDKFANLDNTKVWNWPTDTRKQVIDAFRDIDNITLEEENENYAIRKNLAYLDYYSIWNDISLSSKEFVNIKNKLENNTVLNVSSNTKIYSGKDNVKLFYHLKDETEELSITLDKHKNISFSSNITITWIEWEAYLESNISKIYSGTEIYKLLWLPILPGTKILSNSVNNDLSHLDINYYDWSNINILFRETNSYTLYDLWNYSDDYLVRTKVPNDFYYSKISWFKSSIFSTTSNQSIFSPQLKADNLAPELDLDSWIKVPVYISKEINLTDNVSENWWISNLKEVYIDSNLQLDSDSDWDATNDKDNLISDWKNKANIEVLLSNISLKLKILAFDNIFTKNIRIYLVDKNNNIWYKDVSLQVYAPIPEIKSDSSNTIIWTIWENLLNEKIDLYRLRGGSLKRLTKDSIMTDSEGNFSYRTDSTKWLILKKWDTEIASINEITWIIDLKDKSYKINVIPANKSENWYTNIVINDWTKDVYYEYIVVPDISNVKVVSDFSDLSEKWVYFKMTNKAQYSYSLLPSDITNNAWEVIVYDVEDTKHSAIFSITKDWRINVLNNNFKIEYEIFKEKPIYKLIRNDWVEVARLMSISELNFIMK